jgi:hypothetical protein
MIDLQRAGYRKVIRQKYRVKDLAELYFSSCLTGVFTRTDYIRFAHVYFGENKLSEAQKKLCKKIRRKKRKIQRHHNNVMRRRSARETES